LKKNCCWEQVSENVCNQIAPHYRQSRSANVSLRRSRIRTLALAGCHREVDSGGCGEDMLAGGESAEGRNNTRR
jgi:hypothetical protein